VLTEKVVCVKILWEIFMAQRIRRVDSIKEMERVVDDFITQGYKAKSRGEESARLVKEAPKDKHLLVALLTIWWTFGLGNLLYAVLPSKIEDDVLVRLEAK
jgi:hypothetical protein